MDPLSDALHVIRLTGALFLDAEFREPWCVEAPSGQDLARMVAPNHERVAICHLITEGRCSVRLPDGEPLALEAGDMVTFPQGDGHLLGAGHGNAPPTLQHRVAVQIPQVASASYGGTGRRTVAVCGWFAFDREIANLLTGGLPKMFLTNLRRRRSGAWIEGSMSYAADEARSGAAGANAVTDRLAELLFVEALRGYIETLPPHEVGWLAGLRDPIVGRCIALMHAQPAEAWTVASLAKAVHVSRSVLAERFTACMGDTPMHYLARWRTAKAAHLLREGRLTLGRVAEEVGYASEAAFSRAFRGAFGVPPGTWRRRAVHE